MDIYLAGSSHKGFNPWMQNRGYNKLMSYVYDKNGVNMKRNREIKVLNYL